MQLSQQAQAHVRLGSIGLVTYGALLLTNFLNQRHIIPPPTINKYWTAVDPIPCTFSIWGLIFLLIGLFIVYGMVRAVRCTPLSFYSDIMNSLIPFNALLALWPFVWYTEFHLPALILIGAAFSLALRMYSIVVRESTMSNLSNCSRFFNFPGSSVLSCARRGNSSSATSGTASASEGTAATADNAATSEQEPSDCKCSFVKCVEQVLQTVWARVSMAWLLVALVVMSAVFLKYAVLRATPLDISQCGGTNATRGFLKRLLHPTTTNVVTNPAGDHKHNAALNLAANATAAVLGKLRISNTSGSDIAHVMDLKGLRVHNNSFELPLEQCAPAMVLSATEGVAGILALLLLVLVGGLTAAVHVDGIPSLVFAWAAAGIARHAQKIATFTQNAAKPHFSLANSSIFGRFAEVATNVGLGRFWKIGGPTGERWWIVLHDVAIAVVVVNLVIAVAAFTVRCIRGRRAKTAAAVKSVDQAEQRKPLIAGGW